jgi:outer membrane protein TolC
VRTLYQRLVSELDQLKTLKRASELAEQNYRAQNADYRLGLVTNLEVIQSLNSLQETKRVHDRTYFDAWATLAALEAASGKAQL